MTSSSLGRSSAGDLLGVDGSEPIPEAGIDAVKMGTTVDTNALLERKGDRTLLMPHGDLVGLSPGQAVHGLGRGFGIQVSDDLLGRVLDGFGNRMTVLAVANPRRSGVEPARLHDRGPGYGVARVRRTESAGVELTLENWPRHVDPTAPGAGPYEGWPVVVPLDPLGR